MERRPHSGLWTPESERDLVLAVSSTLKDKYGAYDWTVALGRLQKLGSVSGLNPKDLEIKWLSLTQEFSEKVYAAAARQCLEGSMTNLEATANKQEQNPFFTVSAPTLKRFNTHSVPAGLHNASSSRLGHPPATSQTFHGRQTSNVLTREGPSSSTPTIAETSVQGKPRVLVVPPAQQRDVRITKAVDNVGTRLGQRGAANKHNMGGSAGEAGNLRKGVELSKSKVVDKNTVVHSSEDEVVFTGRLGRSRKSGGQASLDSSCT
ncbi:hypothetical protein SCAR479_08184 [Seiridium cardinale]|uniref:Myb-like domain-containing protein n=1 Tax=Seiridium cardinale TaxID=138064 RepID=A0ABR2XN29_9PEZI